MNVDMAIKAFQLEWERQWGTETGRLLTTTWDVQILAQDTLTDVYEEATFYEEGLSLLQIHAISAVRGNV